MNIERRLYYSGRFILFWSLQDEVKCDAEVFLRRGGSISLISMKYHSYLFRRFCESDSENDSPKVIDNNSCHHTLKKKNENV